MVSPEPPYGVPGTPELRMVSPEPPEPRSYVWCPRNPCPRNPELRIVSPEPGTGVTYGVPGTPGTGVTYGVPGTPYGVPGTPEPGMYNGEGAIDGVRATCLVAEAESVVHFLSHSAALLVASVIAFS